MNPEPETRLKSDAERFELLEHPELWPDDPALQAEWAELLELHLALQAHGPALQPASRPRTSLLRPRSSWMLAAAATLMAIVPTIYVLQHTRAVQQRQAQNRARIDASAQQRGQGRLWAAFFEQSSDLLKRFDQNPPICDKNHEDRSEERALAMALLEASRQLAGQSAPSLTPDAEVARNELHFWLTELSLEDGCLSPERAQELRRLASAQGLERQAQRLSDRLKGEDS